MLQGTNLTGGDCLWAKDGKERYPQATGPIAGTHYQFIPTPELDRLIGLGMNYFRLVFSWECVQPKPWASPTGLTGNYAIYWNRFKELVDYITSKGCTCVIDIHGGDDPTFGAYRNVKIGQRLPTGEAVADMFENLYWYLAQVFRDNPRVEWGLTNEPIGMTAAVWFATAQRVINTLRRLGAKQYIWAPGVNYSGAYSWVSNGNAAAWNLTDPENKLGVQVHMYMDPNKGGGSTDIVSETIGVDSLKVVIGWARSKGIKVFVGEVGMSAANPLAVKTWANLLTYMRANTDTLAGWCWWATGPKTWWGNYQYTLCDTEKGRANLALIQDALKSDSDTIKDLLATVQDLTIRLEGEKARADSEYNAKIIAINTRDQLQSIVDAVKAAVK